MSERPILEVKDLNVAVRRKRGQLPILRDVSFTVGREETLAVVGESGSGKSMLALTLLRLLSPDDAFLVSGNILFEGQDLRSLSEGAMQKIRGSGISIVFQEALNALNPVVRVGDQIAEALCAHERRSSKAAELEVIRLLRDLGIPTPDVRARNYPHELSGGMRQRVMIAIALACDPKLVICDEPTTSLDVTIQSQILSILRDIREKRGMSMIFISHNLGAVAAVADRIAVMYAGEIVELGNAEQVLRDPVHPYTKALLTTTPRVDRLARLTSIPGTVPRYESLPNGCCFEPRCAQRIKACGQHKVQLKMTSDGRSTRCILSEAVPAGEPEAA